MGGGLRPCLYVKGLQKFLPDIPLDGYKNSRLVINQLWSKSNDSRSQRNEQVSGVIRSFGETTWLLVPEQSQTNVS